MYAQFFSLATNQKPDTMATANFLEEGAWVWGGGRAGRDIWVTLPVLGLAQKVVAGGLHTQRHFADMQEGLA